MTLNWQKYTDGSWCVFLSLNLQDKHFDNMEGVYIIWHGGQVPAVVRVGQGKIKDRIAFHRNDPEITKYSPLGLYVTWAAVSAYDRDGVERCLGECLKPKVGTQFPDAPSIPVNMPWA